jgi:hypothetical protein
MASGFGWAQFEAAHGFRCCLLSQSAARGGRGLWQVAVAKSKRATGREAGSWDLFSGFEKFMKVGIDLFCADKNHIMSRLLCCIYLQYHLTFATINHQVNAGPPSTNQPTRPTGKAQPTQPQLSDAAQSKPCHRSLETSKSTGKSND